jgi:hypothetical protein
MRVPALARPAGLLLCLLLAIVFGACSSAPLPPPRTSLDQLRSEAEGSSDGEVVGRWLLGELILPGGEPARAKKARERLDAMGKTSLPPARGLHASLGRLVDDEAHGRFKLAAKAALDTLAAARGSDDPTAPLAAWYATSELTHLRRSVAGLWDLAKPTVLPLLTEPGNIGWRTRGELVEWWSVDGYDPTKETAKDPEKAGPLEAAARALGCVRSARLAGPFGRGSSVDTRTHFDAEKAGP